MCNFTKGPWSLDFDYLSVIHIVSDADSERGDSFICDVQHEPNAHLIAAAPEMYAILQCISESNCRTMEFVDEINQLLAKARGDNV